jgi:hypothetical protein
MKFFACLCACLVLAGPVWADAYYPDQIEAALREEAGGVPVEPGPAVIRAEEIPAPVGTPSAREPVEAPTRVIYGVPAVLPPEGLDMSTEWADDVQGLELTDERVHTMEAEASVRTVGVWRVMLWGLGRGFANATLGPGELVRGFTYEYTARPWYYAIGTSWLAALGGTLSRLGAGLGDIATAGYFGDVKLAEGYPDYVWQGDWTAKQTPGPDTIVSKEEIEVLERTALREAGRDSQELQVVESTEVTWTQAERVETAGAATGSDAGSGAVEEVEVRTTVLEETRIDDEFSAEQPRRDAP